MTTKNVNGMGVGIVQALCDRQGGDPAVIAKHAEELGFASYWVPEHAVIPKGSDDIYPAKEPGEPTPEYLFKMPDPLIALARASAVTTTIALGTGVALVPERNPLTAAIEIASLDHYSGGRFQYGIGAGWNEPECTVMGGDFEHRWTQIKEAIQVMKKLWTGEYVEHHGNYYDFPPVICKPKPAQDPHPPVLLGSIANPRVFKRVAQWGYGWLPFTADPQEIADGRAEITKFAKAFNRDPKQLKITIFGTPGACRTRSELAEMAKAGADGAVIFPFAMEEKEMLAEIEDLAGAIFT